MWKIGKLRHVIYKLWHKFPRNSDFGLVRMAFLESGWQETWLGSPENVSGRSSYGRS